MNRLPFDPTRVRAAKGASADAPLTVAQVSNLIANALARGLPGKVRVVGEVSNLSQRTHWFFSLKDGDASLRCVCFASTASRISCPVEDGMQVVATGRVDYYNQQGHVQLYVDKIEPVGQGALELRLRQMIEELRGLGYLDEQRKKPLPAFPQRIAVVTSRSAAALQDVIDTARKRWAGCQLLLYDVRVQGPGAAPEIAGAISRLSRDHRRLNIDAILLTRGGGSMEDLWAFNERVVADAIFRCPLPIVAAIGHETDTTVAELVADVRCATPSQAAARLVPERAALEQALAHWSRRLQQDVARQLSHAAHRVTSCANRSLFRRPEDLVDRARRQVDDRALRLNRALPRRVAQAQQVVNQVQPRLLRPLLALVRQSKATVAQMEPRLLAAAPRQLEQKNRRLEHLARHLDALSPRHVLERGYSITRDEDGRIIRDAADAKAGAQIKTMLAQGELRSTVNDGENAGENVTRASTPARKKARRSKRVSDEQLLF